MSESFVVYRFYDALDRLLYVGQSVSVAARLAGHRKDKGCWEDIQRIELIHCANKREMDDLERQLIEELHPLHNVRWARSRVASALEFPSEPHSECEEEMMWEEDIELVSLFEFEGWFYSGYWYCPHCCDTDPYTEPPEGARIGRVEERPDLAAMLAFQRERDEREAPLIRDRIRRAVRLAQQEETGRLC